MRKSYFLLVPGLALALFALPVQAGEIHTPHCYITCPLGTPATNDLVVRGAYTLSSNDDTKFADWVAYKITPATLGPTRDRRWKADPALDDDETLQPADYKDAHKSLQVDRGHMAPLASLAGTEDWETTNYLSNITPQKSALNQGAWLRLESAERDLIRKHQFEAVYVLTGTLYEREMPALPATNSPHRVPSGYWKLVTAVKGKTVLSASFIFDQETPRNAPFCDSATNWEALETRSGLVLRDSPQWSAAKAATAPLLPALGCVQE